MTSEKELWFIVSYLSCTMVLQRSSQILFKNKYYELESISILLIQLEVIAIRHVKLAQSDLIVGGVVLRAWKTIPISLYTSFKNQPLPAFERKLERWIHLQLTPVQVAIGIKIFQNNPRRHQRSTCATNLEAVSLPPPIVLSLQCILVACHLSDCCS